MEEQEKKRIEGGKGVRGHRGRKGWNPTPGTLPYSDTHTRYLDRHLFKHNRQLSQHRTIRD